MEWRYSHEKAVQKFERRKDVHVQNRTDGKGREKACKGVAAIARGREANGNVGDDDVVRSDKAGARTRRGRFMKIEKRGGKIVCCADDWKSLAQNEREFLSDEYWTNTWEWENEENKGVLVMRKRDSARQLMKILQATMNHAYNHDVPVDDEVRLYLNDVSVLAKQEEDRAWSDAQAIEKRKAWSRRKENGCDGCPFKKVNGDDFMCAHSGDELATRIMSVWNAKRKAMEMFHETGEPNKHCIDYCDEKIKERFENGKV